MLVYLKGGSALPILRATPSQIQIKLSVSASQSPGTDPVTPGAWQGISTGEAILKSLVWFHSEKSRRKRESKPGSATLEADALTTRPTRR